MQLQQHRHLFASVPGDLSSALIKSDLKRKKANMCAPDDSSIRANHHIDYGSTAATISSFIFPLRLLPSEISKKAEEEICSSIILNEAAL